MRGCVTTEEGINADDDRFPPRFRTRLSSNALPTTGHAIHGAHVVQCTLGTVQRATGTSSGKSSAHKLRGVAAPHTDIRTSTEGPLEDVGPPCSLFAIRRIDWLGDYTLQFQRPTGNTRERRAAHARRNFSGQPGRCGGTRDFPTTVGTRRGKTLPKTPASQYPLPVMDAVFSCSTLVCTY